MRNLERSVWAIVTVALLAALTSSRSRSSTASDVVRPRGEPGVHLSMSALHEQGGVPLGWQLTMPRGDAAAGRATFDALGCPSCHRVAGEAVATAGASTGPRLAAFETWFATGGRRVFAEADGVVGVDTFVDAAKPTAKLTTLIGFRDEAALRTFMGDPGTAELWKQFDGFIGPHGHLATDRPIVYRAPTLSAE